MEVLSDSNSKKYIYKTFKKKVEKWVKHEFF